MDTESLVFEYDELHKSLPALIKFINNGIEQLSNNLRIFCSIMFSNFNDLDIGACEKVIENLESLLVDLDRAFNDYKQDGSKQAQIATARTASNDESVGLDTLKIDNILPNLINYYRAIKVLENKDSMPSNYSVHVFEEKHVNDLLDYLKAIFLALMVRVPDNEIKDFITKYPLDAKFDKESIIKLCPPETDFKYAAEVGGILKKEKKEDEDFTEADFASDEDLTDEDFSEADFASDEDFTEADFDQDEPVKVDELDDDDDFTADDFIFDDTDTAQVSVGGVPLITEDNLNDLSNGEKIISIRAKKETETIPEYEEYLRSLYAKYGYEPEYKDYIEFLKDNMSEDSLISNSFYGMKLRLCYPHESGKPAKSIEWGDYTINSNEGNVNIYNGYAEYLDYTISQNNAIARENPQVIECDKMIEYLKRRNNEAGRYIYSDFIDDLIYLLEKSKYPKDDSSEYYGGKISWIVITKIEDNEIEAPFDVDISLDEKDINHLIRIIKSLEKYLVDFCSELSLNIIYKYSNGKKEVYTNDDFINDGKIDETIKKDFIEQLREPAYTIIDFNDIDDSTQAEEEVDVAIPAVEEAETAVIPVDDDIEEAIPVEEEAETAVIPVDDDIEEAVPAEEEVEDAISASNDKLQTLVDEIRKKEKEKQALEVDIKKKTEEIEKLKIEIKNKKNAPGLVINKIDKEKTSLLQNKIELYQIIISEVFSRKMEIGLDSFKTILKELYENEDSRKKYGIEYNKENDEYSITNELDGEKHSLTISYRGFVYMAKNNFKKKDDNDNYKLENGKSRVTLNLKGISPEKVDVTKAIIYSCLSDSKISVRGKKLIISSFILNQLAKKQAKANISYSSKTPGINPNYDLDFRKIEDENLEIPLINGDTTKPIIISIFLRNGEEIRMVLEPRVITKTKRI